MFYICDALRVWNNLYNLKNVKNAHGVVLLLVKLPAWACHFSERHTPPRECVPMVHTFFKLHKWYQFAQSITFSVLLITYLQNRTVFDQIDFDEYLLCSFRPMCFQQFIWNNILNFRQFFILPQLSYIFSLTLLMVAPFW